MPAAIGRGGGFFQHPICFCCSKAIIVWNHWGKQGVTFIGAWLGAKLGTSSMNDQLRIVTIRIANVEDGGVRAWSDDLPGLNVTYPNHQLLFAKLSPKIASLLKQQGFDSKIVREIHQFVVEIQAI